MQPSILSRIQTSNSAEAQRIWVMKFVYINDHYELMVDIGE